MQSKRVLHSLVDELPEAEVLAAQRFLEYLGHRSKDPLRVLLDGAPLDDEELAEEDVAAIGQGLADKRNGDLLSQEEVERLFRSK
jgi:predicted transcriptional regulator